MYINWIKFIFKFVKNSYLEVMQKFLYVEILNPLFKGLQIKENIIGRRLIGHVSIVEKYSVNLLRSIRIKTFVLN